MIKEIKGGITAVPGIQAAGVSAGIKRKKNKDLCLITSTPSACAAGVFGHNPLRSAAVKYSESLLPSAKIKGIIINSGNANACTGKQGEKDCAEIVKGASELLKIPLSSLLICSTGVIGSLLPLKKIQMALPSLVKNLSRKGGMDAAQAILTTDTFTKVSALEYKSGDKTIRIGGIAKGSGMIHPRLSTMLCFLATDLSISKTLLYDTLFWATERSFNLISVDGDSSTNDSVICLANGRTGNKKITRKGMELSQFREALLFLCTRLARMIIKDGEGATKFVEVAVKEARSFSEAKKIGLAVASSNLVKTALFGEDPNWGRVLAAAGNAGVNFNPDKITLSFGDLPVWEKGIILKTDQKKLSAMFQQKEIRIILRLGRGRGEANIFTTDLSYEYVKINARYRT